MNLNVEKLLQLRFLGALSCAILILTAMSCDDDDDGFEPNDIAYVSLFQASPNAPDLDIVVDDRQINTFPFNYPDYTGYLRFFTGNRNFKVRPFGASNVVLDTNVSLQASRAYSVFIVDEYPDLEMLLLEDDEQAAAEDQALLRFIHLSPDAPAINLVAEDEAEALFEDFAFREASDFMEVDAGEYDFEVMSADTQDSVLLVVPDINLQAGWYYSFIVRGYASPPAGNSNVLIAQVIVN